MIKDVFNAIGSATRRLFQNWRVLLILLVLYLAMLGSVYLFFSTREATVAQLLLTLALGIIAPVLWLVIQTMAVRYASEDRAGKLLVRSLADFWKLAIIVLPLILLIGLIVYYLGNIEFKSVQETVRSVAAPRRVASRIATVRSTPWQAIALSTLQYLLLGLVLPLASIHLWIEAARTGLNNAFKTAGRTLARAFAPRSVLTYAIGFVVFAIIPYVLVTKRTPVTRPWLDVSLLGARLALAVLLSLTGWVVTVAALTKLAESKTATAEQTNASHFNQGPEHVPAES
jgi:hypothetical protein